MSNFIQKMYKPPAKPGKIRASSRPFSVIAATFFGSGLFPKAPGTWGALATVILAYFFFPTNIIAQITIFLTIFIVGVISSGRAEDVYGKDGGPIVIDESAGMLISIIALPKTIALYLTAFLAFRFYDIIKPYPAKAAERLPSGWGVMMDDIVAGAYALLTVRVITLLYLKLWR